MLDDLGLHATDTLKNIDELLKAPVGNFSEIAEHMPQRLAHALSSMRNIEL